jgi:uracil-DNA glycosylase family protein
VVKSPFPGAQAFLPKSKTIPALSKAVDGCRGCDLYLHATQGVLGEGDPKARIVLIGEQPGDEEDRQKRPFVGPAGKLLDRALADAGINREEVYVTNAVKHFKFEERGKRRLHKKPGSAEVQACQPWLEAEMQAVKPEIIVCLGATAAQAILGSQFRVTKQRGIPFAHAWAPQVIATVHPSAILRAPDDEQRREEYSQFVADLKKVRALK